MEHSIGVGAIVGLVFASGIYVWNSDSFNKEQKALLLICIIFPPLHWGLILVVLAYNHFRDKETPKTNLNSSIDSLSDLKQKGILTESEYKEKVEKIEAQKLEQNLINSVEYKQLKNLLDSKILTKEEFYEKIKFLQKNNIGSKNSNEYSSLKITSSPSGATVINKNFEAIGITPLVINKCDYLNQGIKIIFEAKSKNIIVDEFTNDINVDFDKILVNNPKIEEKNDTNNFSIILLVMSVLLIGCIFTYQINKSNHYSNESPEKATIQSLTEAVDTVAAQIDTAAAIAVENSANFINDTGTDTIPATIDQSKFKKSRKLRYLYSSNAGLRAFFNDGTLVWCPRCDLIRENIKNLYSKEVFGYYIVNDDGSLLIDGNEKVVPIEIDENGNNEWAMIDYFWHVDL